MSKVVPIKPIEVDTGIPLPWNGERPNTVYPWARLTPGDSFFVPGKTADCLNGPRQYQQRKRGWKITMKGVTENGIKGVRVWRAK